MDNPMSVRLVEKCIDALLEKNPEKAAELAMGLFICEKVDARMGELFGFIATAQAHDQRQEGEREALEVEGLRLRNEELRLQIERLKAQA